MGGGVGWVGIRVIRIERHTRLSSSSRVQYSPRFRVIKTELNVNGPKHFLQIIKHICIRVVTRFRVYDENFVYFA